jgi:hypothetical protein
VVKKGIDAVVEKFNAWSKALESLWGWLGLVASAIATLNLSKLLQLLGITNDDDDVPGHAGGGTVEKNKPSIVGEKGWEMFVPRVNGMIYNQQQLAAMFGRLFQTPAAVPAFATARASAPSRSVVVNMGPITINNGMDVALLKSTMRGVIRQEFS